MLFDVVRECLTTALELDPSEAQTITRETTAGDLERWDSLNHLKLLLELERRLRVEFGDDEIAELGSVEALMRAVERKRQ